MPPVSQYPDLESPDLNNGDRRRLMILKEEELKQHRRELELAERKMGEQKKNRKTIAFLVVFFGLLFACGACVLIFLLVPGLNGPQIISDLISRKAETELAHQQATQESLSNMVSALEQELTRVGVVPAGQEAQNSQEVQIITPTIQFGLPPATVEPDPMTFPTVTPQRNPVMPFFDSFDNGLLPEWQLDDYSKEMWGTINGQLAKIASGENGIYVGKDDWSNYLVEFDVMQIDYQCGFQIARTSETEGLLLMMPETYDWWWRNIDGEEAIEGTTIPAQQFPVNVRVMMQGSMFTTYINGVQVLQFNNPAFDHGGTGFFNCYTGTQFDNFRITPLQ